MSQITIAKTMRFIAEIDVMPLSNLLDPQGKTVRNTLHSLNYSSVMDVRIGKHITMTLEADSREQAKKMVNEIAEKILINPIVQYYSFELKEVEQ